MEFIDACRVQQEAIDAQLRELQEQKPNRIFHISQGQLDLKLRKLLETEIEALGVCAANDIHQAVQSRNAGDTLLAAHHFAQSDIYQVCANRLQVIINGGFKL